MTPTTLVIDIGGTNTRVSIARGDQLDRDLVKRYRNAEVAGLDAVIADYLASCPVTPDAACVDGAGPVQDGVLQLTNLHWSIDPDGLRKAAGVADVAILNDLQAQGHALQALGDDALATMIAGKPGAPEDATRLVVNVGTGMNIAPVYRMGGQTLVPPAEAGHIAFAPETEDEWALAQFLITRHGFASVEEALSGRGLETVVEFKTGVRLPAATIMERCDSDPQIEAGVRLFAQIMGRVTGNMTLVHLPFGGVYLVGGVACHMQKYLMRFGFGEAFRSKGRFSTYMDQFAVHAIMDDYAALQGCASHMAELRGA